MGKVIAEMTMSLDGYIAGPGISSKQPMGTNGQKLHEWIFNKAIAADRQWVDDLRKSSGAVITGNHTYTTAIDDAWEGISPFDAPAFVLCHSVPQNQVDEFTYVTAGIHEALKLAKETAAEKNVWVMGGANTIQQYLKAKLVDELRIHIAPVLLMQGTRLFDNTGHDMVELVKKSVTETPAALHLVFTFKK
jgi:dihydrofolate reductase